MASIAETARLVTDLVYSFETTVAIGTALYLVNRRRRHLSGVDLDLSFDPPIDQAGSQDEAIALLLNAAMLWWPSGGGCAYVHDPATDTLRLVAVDLRPAVPVFDDTALHALPISAPPLTLPAWQGAVETRVVRGRELRGSNDAWLELPFAHGQFVVRLLAHRAQMPTRPILNRMTAACRKASPLVASCLGWRNALSMRETQFKALGTHAGVSDEQTAESVAAMLALGRSLTGARDACFVVQGSGEWQAVALGDDAGAYAREVAAGRSPEFDSPVVEVPVGDQAIDRLVFFDSDPVADDNPRLQWVRHLGTYARDLLTRQGVHHMDSSRYMEAVRSVVDLGAKESPHSAGHNHRIARYARWIAEGIGMPPEEIEAVALGAYLHDIGMPYAAPEVVTAEGSISPQAYEQMTQHAEVGALLLEQVEAPLSIAQMVVSHHERWDGTGYPFGLSGTDIPIGGRIIAVSDRFDALTTARTYRGALPFETAILRLSELAGRSLDPDLVDALVRAWKVRQDRAVEGLPALRCWELKQVEETVCSSCPNRLAQVVRCWESPENLCTHHGDQCATCIVFTHAMRSGRAKPLELNQEGASAHA